MKRIFDIIFASTFIVVFMPLMLLISIFIYIESPGEVIFRQTRIGYKGIPFRIFKFRSMCINADKTGTFQTASNDPRITKIGKIIRKASLDELPQMFNVLIGDMSLIGPRPDVIEQKENYTDDEWGLRNSVRPGITGLAQATLRSMATVEQRKNLDLLYAKSHNCWIDAKILYLTCIQVITKGGN